MIVLDCIQGSPEWHAARAGSLGASSIGEMMARTKSGWGASRANLAAALTLERVTGRPRRRYVTAAMERGTDLEADARDTYAFLRDVDVGQVGLVLHPTIAGAHASPDGLVGHVGLLEIKCPLEAKHLSNLMSAKPDRDYELQCQWQMACTGRAWTDLASYYPDFAPDVPELPDLHIQRIERDDAMIAELETAARAFLAEVEATVAELRRKFKLAA